MNVLFLYLNAFSVKGGIQRYNINLIEALKDNQKMNGGELKYISLNDTQQDLPSGREFENGFISARGSRLRFMILAANAIIRADVILFGHINILAPLVFLASLWKQKKTILITHGIEVWNLHSRIKKVAMKCCSHILAVSTFTRDKILKQLNLDPDRVIILHNTLPKEHSISTDANLPDKSLLKKQAGFKEDDFLLLTVCRMSLGDRDKGYANVISSMKTISEMHPYVKYVLVGRIEKNEEAYIRELIRKDGLEEKVILKGGIDDEALTVLYSIADCFIMPSKKEGFGIVFIEALSKGIPCIGGNVDGSVDALLHGDAGILIDPDKENEIIHAITSVITKTCEAKLIDKTYLIKCASTYFSFNAYMVNLKNILTQ